MYSYFKFLIVIFLFLDLISSESLVVRISTNECINEVDTRFMSFTVDPKYLFTSTDSFNSQECICMASSLTPAFLRLAGPSTPHMSFHNTTITIGSERHHSTDPGFKENSDELLHNLKVGIENIVTRKRKREIKKLKVTHRQWKKFIQWANTTGFDLVLALNNHEKTASGMWDPNSALSILTVADKANVGDIYWQLGYECSNQTLEDYLNDLETLRVITETFKEGDEGRWKVISGDITNCLQSDSKSDFKDFVTLSDELMDAIFLNGNSSVRELNRMSEGERQSVLQYLSRSTTPLWFTETKNASDYVGLLEDTEKEELEGRIKKNDPRYQLIRAADWMTSLGYSARNGFSVHFRELEQNELFQPTLSFYMALLYKNLVGTRVLQVSSDAVMFGHCSRLRDTSVPGAVTLYAANLRDTHARYAVKMSEREEGGDIMQFVLGMDKDGNIVVNGKVMQQEGDIKPVLKRVRPYKTLLLHLPPKSFGFWVLANTNVEACQYDKQNKTHNFVKAEDVRDISQEENLRKKRSLELSNAIETPEEINLDKIDHTNDIKNSVLLNTLQSINKDLITLRNKLSRNNKAQSNIMVLKRSRRQLFEENEKEDIKLKLKRRLKGKDLKKIIDVPKARSGIVQKLKEIQDKISDTKHDLREEIRRKLNLNQNNLNKRHVRHYKDISMEQNYSEENYKRKRRSILAGTPRENKHSMLDSNSIEDSAENEIDTEGNKKKINYLLRKLHIQLKNLPENKGDENDKKNADSKDSESEQNYINELEDKIAVQNKISEDKSIINFDEKSHGFIVSSFESLLSVLEDLSSNLSRIWNSLSMIA